MNYMADFYDFQVPDHIGRVIYRSFERFWCTFNWLYGIYNSQLFFGFYVLNCLKASSLRYVILLQKLFKSTYL